MRRWKHLDDETLPKFPPNYEENRPRKSVFCQEYGKTTRGRSTISRRFFLFSFFFFSLFLSWKPQHLYPTAQLSTIIPTPNPTTQRPAHSNSVAVVTKDFSRYGTLRRQGQPLYTCIYIAIKYSKNSATQQVLFYHSTSTKRHEEEPTPLHVPVFSSR